MTRAIDDLWYILIRDRGQLCERCGNWEAIEVHHIDKNPRNNEISNLLLLCKDCHRAIHKAMRRKSSILCRM